MSFLFASSKSKQIPALTGLQIQTAVNVLPIPICWGMPRTSLNIIYANGFQAIAQKAQGSSGLLSKGGQVQYKYYATWISSVGEGPMRNIAAIFDNQSVYTPASVPRGRPNFQILPGDPDQLPSSWITSHWPSDAFGYTRTMVLVYPGEQLDASATIPQIGLVPVGLLAGTSPLNLYTAPNSAQYYMDADPGQVIPDFLSNGIYGAGFPAAYVDLTTLLTGSAGYDPAIGDAALSTYCQATGMAWSVVLNNSEPASSVLDRWCKNLVVAPVWTGAILKFIPYWGNFVNTNPGWGSGAGIPLKYYTPNMTPLFDLTDDDFSEASEGEDPVVVTRIDIADVKNTVRVDFRDRFNYYNDNIAEARDDNATELYGHRVDSLGTADEFTHSAYAGVSAQMNLQRNMSVRNTYEFKLGWQYCILDPMDIVTITDTILELDKRPVRIKSIEEDEKGILTIVAEEYPNHVAATEFTRQTNSPPTPPDTALAPPDVNPPFIFEPTAAQLAAQGLGPSPTIVVGACGGPAGVFDANWGGCNVWISNDDVTYQQMSPALDQPSRMGVTTAILADYDLPNPDTTNTLSIDLSESNAILDTVTSAQAAASLSLCALTDANGDLELFSYTTATLTGPNTYNLTGLYRGLYGTVSCSHPSGSQFLRLDSLIFETPLPSAMIGQLLYVKLQSFNIYNQSPQDLADCTAYTYTPLGSGVDLTIDPVASALLAGGSVDLNTTHDEVLDLNLGGGGPCSPLSIVIDLNLH